MRLSLQIAFALTIYAVLTADIVTAAASSYAGGLWDQIALAVQGTTR